MKQRTTFADFLVREWLAVVSAVGVVLTSLAARRFPAYSADEFQVLFLLFVLFVGVKGLELSGGISRLAWHVGRRRMVPLTLVLTTFFLSMVVTNDVALLVIVPVTLSLHAKRMDVLVILEALAANAGSAFTPFGNPQNLYIYWHYGVSPGEFLWTMGPMVLLFALLLPAAAFFVETGKVARGPAPSVDKKAYGYGLLLLVVVLSVLRVLPLFSGLSVVLFALLFDRKALRLDYSLLITFVFFFGISDNLQAMLATEVSQSEHLFLFSALASQVMSNVPATLLFANFTSDWKDLLWGVNAGGFGSLIGSLANLIAFRLYVTHEDTGDTATFAVKFALFGYGAFLLSIALYVACFGLASL